jgi:hypothetical protein
MRTIILFTGRDENGVFHQSQDCQTYISRETGLISHKGAVIAKLSGNARKATIEDINRAIKGNADFELSIESDKYWHNEKLEIS